MATIKVKNPSSTARSGVVTFGIPFSRGFNLQSSDILAASNAVSGISDLNVQWYGQGAVWDTGAIKYARCALAVDLGANEEKEIEITRAPSATSPGYAPNAATLSGLGGANIQFTIQGTSYTFPMSSVLSGNFIEGNSGTDHYRRIKYFTHLPATSNPQMRHVWVDLVIDLYDNTPFSTFYFRWGYYRFDTSVSNANGVDPRMELTQPVTLSINGPRTTIRWEEQCIPSITEISSTNRVFNLIDPAIPDENRIVAGGSHCYKGVFAFDTSDSSDAELDSQILAMAVDWKDNYPITGVMPDYPSYITSEADALSRSNTLLGVMQNNILATRGAHNWSSLINSPSTGDAGTHGVRDYAYGMRGWPILKTTNLDWIPYLEYTTRTQALRHNWYYRTNGTPVSPNQFYNAGSTFWNGAFHFSGSENYNGYNRRVDGSDPPKSTSPSGHSPRSIYGPDKEHFTNKMFILQGLITMDWFSLEYAKMYSKYWIYANRTDYYGGYPSAINTWGVPRAIGRVSECAAWLLEFYADSELETWLDDRLTYNANRNGAQLLDKTQHPGGTEVTRVSDIQVPCGQAACLNSLEHWRPWEEGQFVLGQYLLAKQLLNTNPNSPTGLRTLEMARDVAGSILLNAYKDGRSTTTRRYISLIFNSESEADAFKASIGNQLGTVTASSSGGSGRIYLYHNDTDVGGTLAPRTIKLYLNQATGSFTNGEQVTISTGLSGTMYRRYLFAGGAKSMALTSPSQGYARKLTDTEIETASFPGEDVNYAPPFFPAGYFKYAYWYFLYEIVQVQAVVVAREAAQLGFYADSNAEIIAKGDDLINFYSTGGYNEDNGDFEETFLTFAGYLVPDLLNESVKNVIAGRNTSFGTIPTPTVTVETNSVSATQPIRDTAVKTLQFEVSEAKASATNGSTDAFVVLPSIGFNISTTDISATATSLQIGSVIVNADVAADSAGTAEFSSSTVDDVYTTSITLGKTVYQYVYIGEKPTSTEPLFINETQTTIGEIPSNIPLFFVYHRTLVIKANNSPISDYYTKFPITPIQGLIGESIGLNGQTLGTQGYTWQLPVTSSNPLDTVVHNVDTEGYIHDIGINSRGCDIQSWNVTVKSSGEKIAILTKPTRLHGVVMNETFDLNKADPSRLIYNPNFGGAITPLEGTENTFVSPNRLLTNSVTKFSTVFEGAVTPLDAVSYAEPHQNHGGAFDEPIISRDMKQYYNLSIGSSVDPDAVQLDSWSFHAFGIPDGPHQLRKDLSIDVPDMFGRLYAFDPRTQTSQDLSLLLLNTELEITIRTDGTEIIAGDTVISSGAERGLTSTVSEEQVVAEDDIVPSSAEYPIMFSTGAGAIICEDTDKEFVMAMVTSIQSDTSNTTKANELIFENTEDTIKRHRLTLRINNEGDLVERNPGWVGTRVYLLFDSSVQNIQSRITTLYGNQLIDSALPNDGLYIYERPAII